MSGQPRYTLTPTGDGFDTLYTPRYGQTYHSTHGALTEARHVFLEGTGVDERLIQGLPTHVLEVGFGTGLNFLLTAHKAASTHTPIHYVALEKEMLPAAVLARLNHGPRLDALPLQETFLTWRRTLPAAPSPGLYTHPFSDTLSLTLLIGDATVAPLPDHTYHAVYLDAFSPDANPELWTSAFLNRLFGVMAPGGVLATYSAKGAVRRSLEALGFHVTKKPGPPGKREMLVAVRPRFRQENQR